MGLATLFACLLLLADTGSALLTDDFVQWLAGNGYDPARFLRTDISGGSGSFGGFRSPTQVTSSNAVNRTRGKGRICPVVFVHGNSENAGEWRTSREHFLANGYTEGDVYGSTWGPSNVLLASEQYHSKAHLTHTREFLQAVQRYTGAGCVSVVGHSMGVTLARKAIKGGPARDLLDGGDYDLGPRLGDVDVFVGIAGANLGLSACFLTGPTTPTCGSTNGFYPGLLPTSGPSQVLQEMNSNTGYEGTSRYTIWSSADQIIGGGGLVYGRFTSAINGQTGEQRYSTLGHSGVRDQTAHVQLAMVRDHRIP